MVRTRNNCSVIIEDVRNVNTIYRCGIPTLKGKTVRQQPKRAQAEYIEVPDSLKEMIVNITVADDVMFVNRIPIVISILRRFNFTMVKYVSQRLNNVLANSTGGIFQFHKNNRYTIKTLLMDREF